MALRSKEDWRQFFTDVSIPNAESEAYAEIFIKNRMTEVSVSELSREILHELGITTVGDALAIMRHAKEYSKSPPRGTVSTSTFTKPSAIKPPQLVSEMTHPEFRKFKVDWAVYTKTTNLPADQIAPHLYSACDSNVQNSIINTSDDFFNRSEDEIIKMLEKIVTKRSNPTVHRMTFSNIVQSDSESINSYLVRLKSAAKDCEFECPSCKHDLSSINVKGQFIRGIRNTTLQTDILAKGDSLKSIEEIVKHSEAFEAALHDQSKFQDSVDVMALHKRSWNRSKTGQHATQRVNSGQHATQHSNPDQLPISHNPDRYTSSRPNGNSNRSSTRTCPGCGSPSHTSIDRQSVCPAWGKTCHNCSTPNHFASVCRQKKRETARAIHNDAAHDDTAHDVLIAHVEYRRTTDSFTTASALTSNVSEIPAEITPILKRDKPYQPKTMMIFPDSGAGICLAGPSHISQLSVNPRELLPCNKKVTAVGGSVLTCHGWLPVQFKIGTNISRQPLYICEKIDRIYFGRKGCTEMNIIPPSFPYPMNTEVKMEYINEVQEQTHQRPTSIPFPATEENIPKLKEHLIKEFSSTTFNKTSPFKAMQCPPVHIHIKPDAIPYATHVPIPIPLHWRDEVKANLDEDVINRIIEQVPIGEPVSWCSPMIVTTRKDGRPRRTIDLQKLNAQCLRETHHCESPFKLACQVPPNTKKTVLDATDGYHSILLDEVSRNYTTFITQWGRYRYLRLPQGYVAAGDAYTRRYDEIIKNVLNKVKCVDDTLLYDTDIEGSFYHAWDYLALCTKNGITINKPKFQFCQSTVEFAGLSITSSGIRPSEKILAAIREFPTPKDITNARAFFGLVNQISWAYSNEAAMQPFRELVKPNVPFYWDDKLDKLFHEAKELLIKQSIEGIRTYDIQRNTCMQVDWCKKGIGYLLLQQHCDSKKCDPSKAPICCKEGWKLVFAGSRFTRGAEVRYSPTEGEGLSVAWGLEHARMFVLGCNSLIVSVDHKPLLGILNDRDLSSIDNPRILNIKQRTLPYHFTIQYNPGKWHRAADALSRNPSSSTKSCLINALETMDGNTGTNQHGDEEPEMDVHTNSLLAHIYEQPCIGAINEGSPLVTLQEVAQTASTDREYKLLMNLIETGFPTSRNATDPSLRQYWSVRDRLSLHNGIAMMNSRLVIPVSLRQRILKGLHLAHQGVSGMLSRANQSIYWPSIETAIRNTRHNCLRCNELAPSHSKESLIPSPAPQYPFQQICMDYFHIDHHTYLSSVDRYSAWITLYHLAQSATSKQLISTCRSLFIAYGVAEELSSDGGPQFTSHEFQHFLRDWGVSHRLSSALYPQSNGRAELGVKSAKRIIYDCASPDGSLDNDKLTRSVLQYHNTPLIGSHLSPAQMLLHRQLRDHIPTNPQHYRLHKEWVLSAEDRERAFADRHAGSYADYNAKSHTLQPLQTQAPVRIQNKRKWDRTGRIVEVLPHRQYRVRVDGSGRVVLRNRRFLRLSPHAPPATIIPSADRPNVGPAYMSPGTQPQQTTVESEEADPISEPSTEADETTHVTVQEIPAAAPPDVAKLPKALRDIADFNNRGAKETQCDRPRLRPRAVDQ